MANRRSRPGDSVSMSLEGHLDSTTPAWISANWRVRFTHVSKSPRTCSSSIWLAYRCAN